jgi:hypothetical protein
MTAIWKLYFLSFALKLCSNRKTSTNTVNAFREKKSKNKGKKTQENNLLKQNKFIQSINRIQSKTWNISQCFDWIRFENFLSNFASNLKFLIQEWISRFRWDCIFFLSNLWIKKYYSFSPCSALNCFAINKMIIFPLYSSLLSQDLILF